MKTLIIDDDGDILRLLYLKLSAQGFDVEFANDGSMGSEMARKIEPDLIVLETELANKHGHEIIREVKKGRKSPPLVIILSHDDSDGAIEAGFAAGADDYMTKPFSPRVLLERIRVTSIRTK